MPRQLANRPRAHPPPHTLSRLPHAGVAEYPVLPTVSRGCPGAGGRLPTCYSAVRHSIRAPKGALTVRLACVRRAASVHPEPGSNSPFKSKGQWPSHSSKPGVGPSLCPLSLNVLDSDSLGQRNKGLLCSTLRHFYLACLSRRSHRSQYPVLKVRPRRLRPSRGTRRPQRRDEIYAPPGPPARGRGRLHGTHTTEARRVSDADLDWKPPQTSVSRHVPGSRAHDRPTRRHRPNASVL